MVGALDGADAARASRQRRQLRVPAPLIGRDMDDAPVADMRVNDAAAAAIMPAGAGDDALAGLRRRARRFVDDPAGDDGPPLLAAIRPDAGCNFHAHTAYGGEDTAQSLRRGSNGGGVFLTCRL
jgi:hypothetical protein